MPRPRMTGICPCGAPATRHSPIDQTRICRPCYDRLRVRSERRALDRAYGARKRRQFMKLARMLAEERQSRKASERTVAALEIHVRELQAKLDNVRRAGREIQRQHKKEQP